MFGLKPQDFIVGFVGRLTYEKGVLDLIRAFNFFKKSKTNVKLLLVGESRAQDRDGISRADLDREINGNPDIILFGYSEKISELLSAMNLFCLPSFREGVPRVVIEAMLRGVPVLGSRIRGVRELVTNGDFLFEPGDWRSLACKLEVLYADTEALSKVALENSINASKMPDESEIAELQIKILEAYHFTKKA